MNHARPWLCAAFVACACSCSEQGPILQGWVPFARFRTDSAQRHSMIEGDILPDFGCFADDDTHPAEAHINAIADAGITLGCSATDFCPWSKVTRAQMASFLARAFLGAES